MRFRRGAPLAIHSPSGFTDTIVRHVSKELMDLGLEMELTRRGAIRSIRKGICAEGARDRDPSRDVWAQVTHICDNGRLSLASSAHGRQAFPEARSTRTYPFRQPS